MVQRSWLRALASTAVLAAVLGAPAVPAHAAGLSAPTGLTPTAITVTGNPVLTWLPVAGAVKYDVDVARDESFSTTIYDATTDLTAATPKTTIVGATDGTVFWRVRGVDGSGTPGAYATAQFWRSTLAGPTLLGPPDGALLGFPEQPPVLSWSPLTGVAKYNVQVDDAPDFIGATTSTTNNPSLALTAPQPPGPPNFWRVQGVTNDGVVTAWSETRSYSTGAIGAPALTYPPNTTTDAIDDVVLMWDPVPGAVTYHLQYSPNGDFSNNTTDVAAVKSTRWSPSQTLANGSYYWRVQAADAQGAYGDWSTVRSFRRGWPAQPTLQQPATAAIATDQGPTFRWSPVAHADRYELDLGTDQNFTPGTYMRCVTRHPTFTPQFTVNQQLHSLSAGSDPNCYATGTPQAMPLNEPSPGVLLYWRAAGVDDRAGVAGDDAAAVPGVFSGTGSFVYQPNGDSTGGLTLVSPADGATVTVPTLSWTAVPQATSYQVLVFDRLGSKVSDVVTDALSWTPASALNAANSPFTWRVAAKTQAAVLYASLGRTFTLATTTAIGASPDPLQASPQDGARMPALSWSAVTGATSYQVWFKPSLPGSDTWYQFIAPGTTGNYAYPATTYSSDTSSSVAVLTAGTYDWHVVANTATGPVMSASAQYTIDPMALTSGYAIQSPHTCPDQQGLPALCDTPTLSWSPVAGAGFYYVYVSTDAAHTNVVHTYATNATTLTPRESLRDSQAGETYYWFVRPCLTALACGPLGDPGNGLVFTQTFEKQSAGERGYPASDSGAAPSGWPTESCTPAAASGSQAVPVVSNQITLCWDDYLALNQRLSTGATQEAKSYRVQLSTTPDFSGSTDSVDVDQTTYTASTKTYPEGPVYWRVQAVDGSDNALTPSPTYEVVKSSPPPAAVAPTSGARVDQAPVLSWQPQAYAASYEVEIYKNADAANGDSNYSLANRVVDVTTKEAAYLPTSALASDTYAWRVRRLDADNRPGPWQQQIAGQPPVFDVRPAAPALLGPASGSAPSARALLFTWTAAPAAAAYRFESSTNSSFTAVRERVDTVSLGWAPTSLYPSGTYYWRVSAIDGSGHVLAPSTVWTFTLDSTPPTVTSRTPTFNAALTGTFSAVLSEPVRNVSPATVQLVAAGSSTPVPAAVTQPTATSVALRPATPLEPGRSYAVRLTGAITDLSGNPLAPYSWTVRASTIVDSASPVIRETWDRDTSTGAVGGSYSTTSTRGATATVHFYGSSAQLLGRVAPDSGYAAVRLDGGSASKVTFYRWRAANRHIVWSRAQLTAGWHTVTVSALGTKPSVSHGTWVSVDALRMGTTTVDDRTSAWSMRFRVVNSTTAYDKSYDIEHQVAQGDTGSRATYALAFTGAGFTLDMARSRTSGKVGVIVDGHAVATLDLYGTTTVSHVLVLTRTLTSGHHTLTLVMTGAHDSAARGTDVGLDEVIVR